MHRPAFATSSLSLRALSHDNRTAVQHLNYVSSSAELLCVAKRKHFVKQKLLHAFSGSQLYRSVFYFQNANRKLFSLEKLFHRNAVCLASDSSGEESAESSQDQSISKGSLSSLNESSGDGLVSKTVDMSDPALIRKYTIWRWRVFFGLFFGYIFAYFTRGSFTYVSPVLRSELGMSMQEIGVITSIFPITYGFSKFISGMMADKLNPAHLFAIGLIATGLLNIALTFSTSITWMSLIWGLTGWFAAFGSPVCTKLMAAWFSQSERGTWCGVWNTSQNLGGFLITVLAGWAATNLGWKQGMIIPGLIGMLGSLYVLSELKESPESMGMPSVEEFRKERPKEQNTVVVTSVKKESLRTILFKHVLSNPCCWLLAFSYFFFYFIRSGVTNWSHFYLMDAKGVKDASEAAIRVSGREIGGLFGSLCSGWVSDNLFGGRRIPTIAMFMVGIAISVAAFWAIPVGCSVLDWWAIFAIGFFLYGPQMLIGLAGIELVDKSAVATSTGFLGWIGYLGASASGAPLTMIVKTWGWNAFFLSLLACCALCTLLLLPMWNRKTHSS